MVNQPQIGAETITLIYLQQFAPDNKDIYLSFSWVYFPREGSNQVLKHLLLGRISIQIFVCHWTWKKDEQKHLVLTIPIPTSFFLNVNKTKHQENFAMNHLASLAEMPTFWQVFILFVFVNKIGNDKSFKNWRVLLPPKQQTQATIAPLWAEKRISK